MSEDDRATQRQLLIELATLGNCRAVVLERLEDREALLAMRAAIQQACLENSLLSRAHFVVVAMTPVDCRLAELAERVEQALMTLQVQRLDMLLLQAQSLPGTSGLHARKQVVLEAWEHMIAIQQVGLVQHIGVSDFSVQDVDFLLTAYPSSPPQAWSMEIQLPGVSSSDVDVPVEDVAAFAHAHGIDMITRFQFNHLDSLEPRDLREDWHLLTQNLAEKYRERPFKFLVTHESEGTATSYHMESHALADTKVMQTPLQIFVRYLLQKGFVVVPQESGDIQDDEATIRELFGPLAHPFTAIHPSCSPHKLHASLLTRNDLAAIDRAMPLTTLFPLPAPPRTPISTTGTSRPGSTQERRITLPTVISRPPTAD